MSTVRLCDCKDCERQISDEEFCVDVKHKRGGATVKVSFCRADKEEIDVCAVCVAERILAQKNLKDAVKDE